MNGKSTIKTILVIVILVLVGVLGVFGLNTAKTYMSGATVGYDPKGVAAKSSDDGKSATITWTTEKPVMAIVEYGTTPASLLLRAIEPQQSTSHSVTISPLKSNVSYYYRIRVRENNDEDTIYDNSGIPFSFKTKAGDSTTATNVTPTQGLMTPTSAVVPTITQTLNNIATGCDKTTDYNKDGIVNSLDMMNCLRNKSTGSTTVATATAMPTAATITDTASPSATSECKPGVDYNNDGLINVMDMIKCRQDKAK